MRIIIADCCVRYEGRLNAYLPQAKRLIIIKADGSISIHSDGGAYKPMNWMNAPNILTQTDDEIRVSNTKSEILTIQITEILADNTYDLGDDPSLQKDGVEANLQVLLAEHPEHLGQGYVLIKKEFMTEIGPVDLLCKDTERDIFVAVEIKRRGEIDGVEQLTRYLEFIEQSRNYLPLEGMLVAQSIKPQAKKLAVKRGIKYLEVDYNLLCGVNRPQQSLF